MGKFAGFTATPVDSILESFYPLNGLPTLLDDDICLDMSEEHEAAGNAGPPSKNMDNRTFMSPSCDVQ